jgi:hypothetical protein
MLVAIAAAASLGLPVEAFGAATQECGVFRIGWALNPPTDGEIREFHWDTVNYTELWMPLKPQQSRHGQAGVPDLLFVFSICFRGRTMPPHQDSVELRVQVNRNFFAALVPDPQLEITIDSDARYDLTGGDFKHWTEYPNGCRPGDICIYTAVLVDLPVQILRRIVAARMVRGTISGTPFELSGEQRLMLDRFVRRIAGS